jgi:hypothetical protein
LEALKAESTNDIDVEHLSDPSLPATTLDLTSEHAGLVNIEGDNVLIKSRGRGITFTGRLAPGTHSLLTRQRFSPSGPEMGIELILPTDMCFEVDAQSLKGPVKTDFPVVSKDPSSSNTLKGVVGIEPKVSLELRTDEGLIEIRKEGTLSQRFE